MTDVVKEEVLVAFSVEEILDDADEVAETETACWGCDWVEMDDALFTNEVGGFGCWFWLTTVEELTDVFE